MGMEKICYLKIDGLYLRGRFTSHPYEKGRTLNLRKDHDIANHTNI